MQVGIEHDCSVCEKMHRVGVAEGAVGSAVIVLPESLDKDLHETVHLLGLSRETKTTSGEISDK